MRKNLWILLLALALPRVIRCLYPALWVEDDQLLQTVFAKSRGLRPYADFSLAQMPLLEWLGAAYVRVAGASLRSMEWLNAAAIYATSVLTVLVGRRTVGQPAAVAGGLLFACSSLVFRYHLWAREFFVSALVLSAALVILSDRLSVRAQVWLFAALSVAAAAIKLTAAVSVAALLLFVAFGQRRKAHAATMAIATAAGMSIFAAWCYSNFGFEFVFQAFLFHFLKGTVDAGLGYAATILDVLVPLSALGAIALFIERPRERDLLLLAAMLGLLVVFYGLISPTAWGHNYLDLLPWIAMAAGSGLAWLIRESRRLSWRAGAGLALAAALLSIAPINGENASRGSVYGFGFVPRPEIAALAGALRAGTKADEEVVAPSFIAFEANRLQRLRFPENYGVMREGMRRVLGEGYWAARETFGRRNFFELINETSSYWNQQFVAATDVGGAVNAVILDSPIQFIPLVNAAGDALSARGFRVALTTAHYTLWLRPH